MVAFSMGRHHQINGCHQEGEKKRFKSLRINIYFGTDFLILLSSGIILSTFQLLALLLKQYLLVGSGFSTLLQHHDRRGDSFHVAQSQGIFCQNNPGSIRSCGWYFGSVVPTCSLLFRSQSTISSRHLIPERTLYCKMHCPEAEGIRFSGCIFSARVRKTCTLSHSEDGSRISSMQAKLQI